MIGKQYWKRNGVSIDSPMLHRNSKLLRHYGLSLMWTLVSLGCARPPADSDLEARFRSNRQAFEQMARMVEEDRHLTRIAPNYTWLDDDISWPRPNIGLSLERWNLYRRLFKETGATAGILRPIGSRTTFLIAYSFGLVTGSTDKGYAFCWDPLAPLFPSLDRRPGDLKKGQPAFKRLEDNWYIYYESD